MLVIVLWGLGTHFLMKLGGEPSYGIGRTFEALCYSSGANAFTAVQCLGPYFSFVGWIWWMISAVFTVKEGQRVSGGRAAFAVLTPPLTVLALAVAGLVLFISIVSSQVSAMAKAIPTPTTATAASVTAAVRAWGQANGGTGPAHAIQLVMVGHLTSADFVDATTVTWEENVPIGDTTLDQWDGLTPEQQATEVQAAVAALPADVVAHRVGDYVFTYHGIDLNNPASGQLWIVIFSPDPGANTQTTPLWYSVGFADGTTLPIQASVFPMSLQMQNILRQQQGLPPLPDPATVTHESPAPATSVTTTPPPVSVPPIAP